MSTRSMAPAAVAPAAAKHSWLDDAQALGTAVVMASLGLALLGSAGLMTGGTPGLAFLLSYASGLPLGAALFLVNLPFYALGWRSMGRRFTLKTLGAVTALALGVELVRRVVTVHTPPMYASVAGGVLIGTGLLVMFRHKASLGGINILALFVQQRLGWSAGKVQMVIDLLILAGALFVLDVQRAAWSALGSLAVNAVLVWNHRPGRYLPGA